jgi:hypothetical protein
MADERGYALLCRKIRENDTTLKVADFSNYECGDEEFTAIGNALEGNTHLKKLLVSSSPQLTAAGATAFSTGLRSSHIKMLRLGGNEMASELKQIIFTALQSLEIDELDLDQGFTLDEAAACCLQQALHNKTLQTFSFSLGPDLTVQGANYLSSIVRRSRQVTLVDSDDIGANVMQALYKAGIKDSDVLKALHLNFCDIGDVKGLTSTFTSLRHLMIFKSDDLKEHIKLFSSGLKSAATNLEWLDIMFCGLGDDGLRVLSEGLGYNRSITSLQVSMDPLGDVGVAAFIENWPQGSPIKKLSLGSSQMTVHGAGLLLAASSSRQALKTLNLGGNRRIGYSGLLQLARDYLPTVRLSNIHFDDCLPCPYVRARTETEESQRKSASQAVLDAVRVNLQLDELHFSQDEILASVYQEILFLLFLNQRGRNLFIQSLSPSVWCYVLAKRHKTYNHASTIFFFLREQPTLFMPSAVTNGATKRPRRD